MILIVCIKNFIEINYHQEDLKNFLHNVFWVEKFGEVARANVFHCWSNDPIQHEQLEKLNVLKQYSIKNCWPYWDKFDQRVEYDKPSLARDGQHYGIEHHKRFAELFLENFGRKLR